MCVPPCVRMCVRVSVCVYVLVDLYRASASNIVICSVCVRVSASQDAVEALLDFCVDQMCRCDHAEENAASYSEMVALLVSFPVGPTRDACLRRLLECLRRGEENRNGCLLAAILSKPVAGALLQRLHDTRASSAEVLEFALVFLQQLAKFSTTIPLLDILYLLQVSAAVRYPRGVPFFFEFLLFLEAYRSWMKCS